MINNTSTSGQGLGNGYLNASTLNGIAALGNYYTGGMYGLAMEGALDLDKSTGGALSAVQDAALYPSKMLTQSMLGNTESGKNWIDFVEANFTVGGNRARRYVEDKADEEAMLQGSSKRRKVDFTSDYKGNNAASREVDVNKKMKERSGKIFQAPRGYLHQLGRAAGRLVLGDSAGHRLKQISQMNATLSSY